MSSADDEKVGAALGQAVRLLETAIAEQERAVNRILGLAERIHEGSAARPIQLQAEGVMEACAFQDLTGQSIRKVVKLIRFLRDKKLVAAGDLPGGGLPRVEGPPPIEKTGLSQAEVDRLLAGKPAKPKG